MIDIKVKSFQELNVNELYDILQLRSEVFVVEQNCVYQDIDGKDRDALHIMGLKNNKIIAYTRVFNTCDYLDYASIGRVLVSQNERQFKYGYTIMNASINAIGEHFKLTKIKISAQTYLKRFYNNLEFFEHGEGYLEDGIPHVLMLKQ